METIFEFLREGDELVVHRLDRLGRSTRDVLNLVHELDTKGASLQVLEPEVSTAGDLGRMVVTLVVSFVFLSIRTTSGTENSVLGATNWKTIKA
ncbi:recombinase family protein [Ruegeria arenilitoris]|uniref:recombinase family protein n=1 Tax=Ruegeria arenilitoris TaxID=1173585 RepID=UPI0020C2938F|nr:recombinase family protein [Ruegeria arenilitoris]